MSISGLVDASAREKGDVNEADPNNVTNYVTNVSTIIGKAYLPSPYS